VLYYQSLSWSVSFTAVTIQILIYQKEAQNVDYFNYLGSMITNDATFTHESKSMIAMAREALNKKKVIFIFVPCKSL